MRSHAAAMTAVILLALGCGDAAIPRTGEPEPFSNHVTQLDRMERIDAGEGELIHLLRGEERGFSGLSFILTETAPGGGPPIHRHTSEEAHVLFEGRMTYWMGGERHSVEGPYVVRIPAGMPHTFVNSGDSMLHLAAVFASARYDFEQLGDNPLQTERSEPPPSADD